MKKEKCDDCLIGMYWSYEAEQIMESYAKETEGCYGYKLVKNALAATDNNYYELFLCCPRCCCKISRASLKEQLAKSL